MFFVCDCIPNQNKTQEMCARVDAEDTFSIVYCPHKYKTQRMCDEATDDSLSALKLIPHWFVTGKNLLLCTQIKIYSTLMKILLMLYFYVMKWVFLI